MNRKQQRALNRLPVKNTKTSKQRLQEKQKELVIKHTEQKGAKKLCLTMIVKNESAIIVRLLDSLKSIIDFICITDTGSTDNTEELIIKWGEDNNIPTKVHKDPFQSFGYNRTRSVKFAKQSFPETDYFLLSDADFKWVIDEKFDKVLLFEHKYFVRQVSPTMTHSNTRFLSAKVDWVCRMRTHEYWTAETGEKQSYPGVIREHHLTTLHIDDVGDGGCKEDKYERDERLLKLDLNDRKNDKGDKTRAKFYLGQTLQTLSRYEESIQFYGNRIKDKGWDQEIFYSKFQIGNDYQKWGWAIKHCVTILKGLNNPQKSVAEEEHHSSYSSEYSSSSCSEECEERCCKMEYEKNEIKTEEEKKVEEEKKKEEKRKKDEEYLAKWNPKGLDEEALTRQAMEYFAEAAKAYKNAHEYRPSRAEALHALAEMFRKLGGKEMQTKCYEICQQGNKIPLSTDWLFVEPPCYDYLFDYEISIVAYYVDGKKDEGKEAIKRLLQRDDYNKLPKYIRDGVESNAKFYQ